MNKTELIKSVAKSTNIDEATVRTVFNGITETIKDTLVYGIDVKIKDFLNFTITTQKESWKNDFNKKTKILVPKYYKVKVSFPRTFKERMKQKTVWDGTE